MIAARFTKAVANAMRLAEFKRLRAEGARLEEIAALTGWAVVTVRTELLAAGVVIGNRGVKPGTVFAQHAGRKVQPEQVPALVAAYLSGEPLSAIADRHGITRQRVAEIAKARGCAMRRRKSQILNPQS